MAAKKTKNTHTKLKRSVMKKRRSVVKPVRKTLAKKKAAPRSASETKPSLKKAAAKTTMLGRKTADTKSARVLKKRAPGKSQNPDTVPFMSQELRSLSAGQ